MPRHGFRFRNAVSALLGVASLIAPSTAAASDFPTSCNEAADANFNDGLMLLHNMMYIQAEEAFNSAAASDPDCAMAHWGIAMANFHPLWPGTPTAAETKRGSAAVERLVTMQAGTSLEEDFVFAAAVFYQPQHVDYRSRLAAWAEAQVATAQGHPENIDAAALGALAKISVAPGGSGRIEALTEIGDTLDALHKKDPRHSGVIHYAIHAYDNPPLKDRGKPYAEIYDKTAPSAPHALHMPAHIFTRTGDWERSIDLNRRSAEAALAQ